MKHLSSSLRHARITASTDQVRVRDARADDILALEAIIRGVGLFTSDEVDDVANSLADHFATPAEGHLWLLANHGQGAAYLAPEPMAGVWNLLFLGVLPEARRQGVARALVAEVEWRLKAQGERMLLIDMSTEPLMAAARALCGRMGFEIASLIPDYWGPGDGKLTFQRAFQVQA